MTLNTNQVNYLNIALMILSAGLAFAYPFELFLFAYAVLGPLHYLTEISWLHDKNYYTQGKRDFFPLVGISVIVSAGFFGWLSFLPQESTGFLTGLAFLAAFCFAFFRNPAYRYGALVPAALLALFLTPFTAYQALFGILFPTLVHVFVFTGMFILVGALRGKSISGFLSLVVFCALSLSFGFFHPGYAGYHASPYVQDSYGYLKQDGNSSSPFIGLNYYLVKALGLHDFGRPTQGLPQFVQSVNDFLYQSPAALSLMAFIAFAYLYHYFNWFSKTSIIGWHHIPRSRAVAILALWGISLGLYAYSYSVGLRWLFFLSFTHVLLEFPLNQLTWVGIGKEIRKLFPRGAFPSPSKP